MCDEYIFTCSHGGVVVPVFGSFKPSPHWNAEDYEPLTRDTVPKLVLFDLLDDH